MLAVFRHALIFGLGPVLQKAASLVLLPLYTHHLTPADYGEIELLTLLVGFFAVVFCFEYRQGYIRALTKKQDKDENSDMVSASILFFVITALAGSACFAIALPFFGDIALGYRVGAGYGAILLLGLFADIMNFLLMATAQARLWSARMVTLGLIQFVIGTGLSVYLIVFMEFGPVSLFIGNTVGSLLAMLALLTMLRGDLVRPAAWKATVAPVLAYSAPLLIGALLYFVLRLVDRIVISEYLSLDDLGIYSMSWKISGLLLTFMFMPFVKSFDVWRFRFYEEKNRTDDVADIARVFIAGIAASSLVLATFGADLFLLVADRRYHDAVFLLPVLNAAVILQCCYSISAAAFFVSGATKPWFMILAVGTAIQVSGSLILVQLIGLQGAGISMLFANLAIYLITIRVAPRYWRVPYQHGLFALIIGAVFILSLAKNLWPQENLLTSLAMDTAILIVFLGLSITLKAVRKEEIRQGISIATNLVHRKIGKLTGRTVPRD